MDGFGESGIVLHLNKKGLSETLIDICMKKNWRQPTKIQCEAIPTALAGHDIIALAETGSGKTGAFALPILEKLLKRPRRCFALILTPTRELAIQIVEQFNDFGESLNLVTLVLVGGLKKEDHKKNLAKKPHIIIATPGCLMDYAVYKKILKFDQLQFLVLDEADRILSLDFEWELNEILKVLPKERKTYLYSATMTKKVEKLLKVSLKNPVKIETSSNFQTVQTLNAFMLFIPKIFKNLYLVFLLDKFKGHKSIVFMNSCRNAMRLELLLKQLGFDVTTLHGQMSQQNRNMSLQQFRTKERAILLSTDVASRGIDIPDVNFVLNYDVPNRSKDYVHRVGRTARAGKKGTAITLVTQYDIELISRIESLLGEKLPTYSIDKSEVSLLKEKVRKAETEAEDDMKLLSKSMKTTKKSKLQKLKSKAERQKK